MPINLKTCDSGVWLNFQAQNLLSATTAKLPTTHIIRSEHLPSSPGLAVHIDRLPCGLDLVDELHAPDQLLLARSLMIVDTTKF